MRALFARGSEKGSWVRDGDFFWRRCDGSVGIFWFFGMILGERGFFDGFSGVLGLLVYGVWCSDRRFCMIWMAEFLFD